jgi:hypothetical protein
MGAQAQLVAQFELAITRVILKGPRFYQRAEGLP